MNKLDSTLKKVDRVPVHGVHRLQPLHGAARVRAGRESGVQQGNTRMGERKHAMLQESLERRRRKMDF